VIANRATKNQVKQAPLHAVVRVHFKNGSIERVTLVASSGDSDLDGKVLGCYESLPSELAASIQGEVDELFVAMLPPQE
jgi:hypothetical protein